MKNFSFLFLLILLSCGPGIKFEAPQPEGKKDLTKFPAKYTGTYLNLSDSSILSINSQQIIRKYDFKGTIYKREFENELGISLVNDTIINVDNMEIHISVQGDSIGFSSNFQDSLFQIFGNNILRKYKGHYFLNHQQGESGMWTVRILKLEKGKLRLENLVNLDEIDDLTENDLVETVTDSTLDGRTNNYIIKPRKGTLKEILKRKEDLGNYLKIN